MLSDNRVNIILFPSLSIALSLFLQTLTTLNLNYNKIGEKGALHLADAFRKNRVSSVDYIFLSFASSHFNILIQTVTTLYLYQTKIGDEGTKHLAHAFRINNVNFIFSCSHLLATLFLHRHSLNYILETIESVMKEPNNWLMLSKITKWMPSSVHIYPLHLHVFIQTLTELSVSKNKIGVHGVQQLADAFRDNKVNTILCSSLLFHSLLFHTDTH